MRVDKGRLKGLFRQLVDAYTPTGKEAEAIDILESFLKAGGLKPIRQTVEEDRDNLILLPEHGEPELLILCHVDTVAAPDWEKAGWTEDGDRIEGLGTADMKAGCAAVAEAFLAAHLDGHTKLPVALAFVPGEEEDGAGTATLLKEWRFPRALVAEPTNLRPCFAHYGYVEAKIEARGRRVHASVAPLGVSPIAELLRFLLETIGHFEERPDGIIYNFRDLHSSPSGFAVPDWCEVWLDMHLPPTVAPAPLIYDLEEILERQRQQRPNLEAELSITMVHEGFALPHKGRFFDFLRDSFAACQAASRLSFQPDSFQSHSDAALLWHEGTKTVILGPGCIEEAHRSGEGVSWSQVLDAAELYTTIIRNSTSLGRN